VLLALLAWWSSVSSSRNAIFATEDGLWREVIQLYPESVRGRNNLGTVLMEQVNPPAADC
jgi:hypothetical protein